ncbi:MAG: Spore maturation protein A [Eubacteriales bacterium]
MSALLNYIWAGLIIISVICAVVTGRVPQLSAAVMSGASGAVELIIAMTGMMCAWTGLMKIADEGGITRILSKLLRPVMRRLFPDYEEESPAIKAICMNITANFLGLGNAATPMGIAAMKEMAKRNPTQTADNSMAMFVVINAASIQLIPTFMGTLRAKYGSPAPFDILPAVWLTSVCSLVVGITVAKLLEGRSSG